MTDTRWIGAEVRAVRNTFAGFALDRAATLRGDPARLAECWAQPGGRVIPVLGETHPLVAADPPRPLLLAPEAVDRERGETVFLGLDGERRAWFAWLLDADQCAALPPIADTVGLRHAASVLAEPEAAMLAYAGAMAYWHRRHRFCGSCGAPTAIGEGGFLRQCSRCAEREFPRTDPAVIVLVAHGTPGSTDERCLLGRQPRWPAGLYSTIAGFVEPGESVEHAVAREVVEETGIRIAGLHYRSSQPWPFPSSLMLGYQARALTDAITIDHAELEDARWFTRAELRDTRASHEHQLPGVISIARRLIDEWLGREY